MNALQSTKYLNLTPPAALVDAASLTVAEIDTLGWDFLTVMLTLGATDIACTAAVLTHGDTSGSGHADIDNTDMDGDTNTDGDAAALPSATDDDGMFVWELNLMGLKRYIDATITVGDGTAGGYYTVHAILSRGHEAPSTIAGRGLKEVLRV